MLNSFLEFRREKDFTFAPGIRGEKLVSGLYAGGYSQTRFEVHPDPDLVAAKLAGNWKKLEGFIFHWDEFVETQEEADCLARIVLCSADSGLRWQATAKAVEEYFQALESDGRYEYTYKSTPRFWLGGDSTFWGVSQSVIVLPVIVPGEPRPTGEFECLYRVVCKILDDAEIENGEVIPRLVSEDPMNFNSTKIYKELKRDADLSNIHGAAIEYGIPLEESQIELVYEWLKKSRRSALKNVDGRGAYPSKRAISDALSAIARKSDRE